MAKVEIKWKKVKELPAHINSWADLKYYAPDVDFPTKQCVYCIRLSPPFMIHYGTTEPDKDNDFVSPLIYIGSGNGKGRLGSHLKWLNSLGQALPSARFEIWFAEPKVRNNSFAYKAFEGYLLKEFEKASRGWLPLRNKKTESNNNNHDYAPEAFENLIKHDRRYTWAVWPFHGSWSETYLTGGKE